VAGAKYKKFASLAEAQEFVNNGSGVGRSSLKSPSHTSSSLLSRPSSSFSTSAASSPLVPIGGNSATMESYWGKSLSAPSRSTAPAALRGDAEIVYTDGSSLGNGTYGARAGVGVYFGPNDPRSEPSSFLHFPSLPLLGSPPLTTANECFN